MFSHHADQPMGAMVKTQPPPALLPVSTIMKPSPSNAQELYLAFLGIGLDVHAHDIRFVEDGGITNTWRGV